MRSGVFTPLSRTGDVAEFVGKYRVSQVIQQVRPGEVLEVGKPITTALGDTDIDLVLSSSFADFRAYLEESGRRKRVGFPARIG